MVRLVLLEPKNLRSGEAGKDVVANQVDDRSASPQCLAQFVALRRGRGVAPELGRANDVMFRIQRDKTMLLAGHADGSDLFLSGRKRREHFPDGFS